jgi:hypothetical protein
MNVFERSDELKQAIGKAGAAVYEATMLASQRDELTVATILRKAMAELRKVLVLVDPQLRVFPTEQQAKTTDKLPLAIADAMSKTMIARDMAKHYGYIAVAGILEETGADIKTALSLATEAINETP